MVQLYHAVAVLALVAPFAAGFLPPAVPGAGLRTRSSVSMALHTDATGSRREALGQAVAALSVGLAFPGLAAASGGATAGKYTSIPVAKRRYYGRVKQAVYEYLQLGDAVKAGDFQSPAYQEFFQDTVALTKGKRKTNCLGNDRACVTDAKFTSRWADMQLSMSLLGNAFRIDASKQPDRIPQVKLARKFFAEMEGMRKAAKSKKADDAKKYYGTSKDILEEFLNLVDLPPTFNEMYAQPPSSTAAQSLCRGEFCI